MVNLMEKIFWETIIKYNQATWFWQSIIILCGAVLTFLLYKKQSRGIKILMKIYLAFCFFWIAIVFFISFGSNELNKYATASFFILLGALWFIDIFVNKVKFEHNKKYDFFVYISYILFLFYPLMSILLKKTFPEICLYLMPCPLTAFTITLLISFMDKIDYKLFVLLIFWALISLPKIFMFNVPEDFILVIVGIFAVLILILKVIKRRNKSKK